MKKWLVISVIIILLGTLVYVINGTAKEKRISEISNTQDTSWNSFKEAKNLALFYNEYLTLTTDSQYQDLKKRMSSRVSDYIYNDIFTAKKYEIYNKEVNVTLNSIKGYKMSESAFEFKVDIDYVSSGKTYNQVYLIVVENNIVTSIDRIF